MPRRSSRSGFTLLEVVVVLILMGVAAAVILPSFVGGLKGLELETAGRDLIVQMKHARSEAIAKQKVFRIILRANSYQFTNDFGEAIEEFKLPEGVVIESDEVELPLQISFYSNGRSYAVSFRLKNRQGKQMQVAVDPITGFAKVIREER